MKLTEITIPKKPEKVSEPLFNYTSRLTSKTEKQKRLGVGAFAEVYQHPKYRTVAVKVSEENKRILRYIEYALKHQDNPYIPRIYGIRRFTSKRDRLGTDKYFVLFLEKLKNYEGLGLRAKRNLLQQHVGEYVNDYDVEIEDFFFENRSWEIIRSVRKMPQTKQTKYLLDLLNFFRVSHASDVHDGNIMIRGKDQLVFTDPMA